MTKKPSMCATLALVAVFGLVHGSLGNAEQTSLGQVQQARPTPSPHPQR